MPLASVSDICASPPNYNSIYNVNVNVNVNENENENKNNTETTRITKFKNIVMKYEIHDLFAAKLHQLEKFKIVMICDDSGSMNTPIIANTYTQSATTSSKTTATTTTTRWTELKHTATVIMELALLLNPYGLDVYFLNRDPVYRVTSQDQIDVAFTLNPQGATPLTSTLRRVMAENPDVGKGEMKQNLLIIVATDGEPHDEKTNDSKEKLKKWLTLERAPIDHVFVEFLACTDDDNVIGYLNKWDNSIKNFDVTDDYLSERAQIIQARGKSFTFSYGDYVVKCLLGSIDPSIDRLDEPACSCVIL